MTADDALLRDGPELAEALDQLGVFGEDRHDLIATLPRAPLLHALVTQTAHSVLETLGSRETSPRLRRAPSGTGLAGRYFYVHVCLVLLPHVLAYHRERGIPEGVSWATFDALATNLARCRRIRGQGGLDRSESEWVVTVFRGLVYRIGRLVFERDFVGPEVAAALPERADAQADALGVHIPASGPLLPGDCDRAFADATGFFAHHFPLDSYRIAHCRAWLLDPQLAEYLPRGSNILRFAERFRLLPGEADGDQAVLHWVLESVDPWVLDPTTSLQRAALAHLRAGGHWHTRLGWLPLPDPPTRGKSDG
ncbi:acyltransferase domain-containing protein [Pseudonocardia spinosispora]|uniref:acyltransferase domain-containing protein n=1 Tax=Pseudonocardia spinosispora TaxID=103441 RepID=UPI000407942A|nr:acyltransferase domain-containing protein [Pseudonocardia spinosispora]